MAGCVLTGPTGGSVAACCGVPRLLQFLVFPVELRAERLEVIVMTRPHIVGELVQEYRDEALIRSQALAVVRAHAEQNLLARILVETHDALRVHADLALGRHLREAPDLELVLLHDAENRRVLRELLEPLLHRGHARCHPWWQDGQGLERVKFVRRPDGPRLVCCCRARQRFAHAARALAEVVLLETPHSLTRSLVNSSALGTLAAHDHQFGTCCERAYLGISRQGLALGENFQLCILLQLKGLTNGRTKGVNRLIRQLQRRIA
mmetsp:Transcript_76111/g.126854  ORF Transcript_76111/g.126854 Transcript_76111/m.126854 type:complete len:264 (-) Transcript_76111:135-926(-)